MDKPFPALNMFRLEYSLYQNFRKPYQLPVSTNNIPYSKIKVSFHSNRRVNHIRP